MIALNMTTEMLERFWAKVDIKDENSCWLWTASLNSKGYGSFGINGSGVSAHKISWALAKNNGILSEPRAHIMHSCDTRNCVNPNHLSLGTPKDNAQDALSKGRLFIRIPSQEEFCKNGHPRTPENTHPKYKTCILCKRESDRIAKAKQRKANPEKANTYAREQYHIRKEKNKNKK